ncbi:MAG: hypothetical protein IJL52_10825 [Clostridia bacterium]|nr:hypothetical protein [Clostridia bacterium]
MNCNKCGAPLHDGAQFCTNCGNIMLSDDDTKTVTIDDTATTPLPQPGPYTAPQPPIYQPAPPAPQPIPQPAVTNQPTVTAQPTQPTAPAPKTQPSRAAQQNKRKPAPQKRTPAPAPKKKGGAGKFAVVLLLIAALIVGAVGGMFAKDLIFKKDKDGKGEQTETATEQAAEPSSMEKATELALKCQQALNDKAPEQIENDWVSDDFYVAYWKDLHADSAKLVTDFTPITKNFEDLKGFVFAYLEHGTASVTAIESDTRVDTYDFGQAQGEVTIESPRFASSSPSDFKPAYQLGDQQTVNVNDSIRLYMSTMVSEHEILVTLIKIDSEWKIFSIEFEDYPEVFAQYIVKEPVTDENGNVVTTEPTEPTAPTSTSDPTEAADSSTTTTTAPNGTTATPAPPTATQPGSAQATETPTLTSEVPGNVIPNEPTSETDTDTSQDEEPEFTLPD